MKKKTICFDLDGVIGTNTWGKYKSAKPIKKNIEYINSLHKNFKIIIFTSRFMGRNKDNVKKDEKEGYKFTLNQLAKWNVKFDKLILALFFKKNWINHLKNQILKLDNSSS